MNLSSHPAWSIPAKTFLLGEYAALMEAPAILLTTSPCFKFSLGKGEPSLIHPSSPAGLFFRKFLPALDLAEIRWADPYLGKGGLGASSAQFIGAYLTYCQLTNQKPEQKILLQTYYQFAWKGIGLKPSGYDVIAQTQNQCVYINKQENQFLSYDWSFNDIAFLLIHSGQKLATHEHLQGLNLDSNSIVSLTKITEEARLAFETNDSSYLIKAINDYQKNLADLHLVAPHSLEQIKKLRNQFDFLAIKGCGAMGADILLILLPSAELKTTTTQLHNQGWHIIGSNDNLYREEKLINENNFSKKLEISSE